MTATTARGCWRRRRWISVVRKKLDSRRTAMEDKSLNGRFRILPTPHAEIRLDISMQTFCKSFVLGRTYNWLEPTTLSHYFLNILVLNCVIIFVDRSGGKRKRAVLSIQSVKNGLITFYFCKYIISRMITNDWNENSNNQTKARKLLQTVIE